MPDCVMLLLAFAAGLCVGMFILVALSIFAVGRAFDGARAVSVDELTRSELDRIQAKAASAANDLEFAIPASVAAAGAIQEAAESPAAPPPPPTPQPPEVRAASAIVARPRCRACYKIRSFAAKLWN